MAVRCKSVQSAEGSQLCFTDERQFSTRSVNGQFPNLASYLHFQDSRLLPLVKGSDAVPETRIECGVSPSKSADYGIISSSHHLPASRFAAIVNLCRPLTELLRCEAKKGTSEDSSGETAFHVCQAK